MIYYIPLFGDFQYCGSKKFIVVKRKNSYAQNEYRSLRIIFCSLRKALRRPPLQGGLFLFCAYTKNINISFDTEYDFNFGFRHRDGFELMSRTYI